MFGDWSSGIIELIGIVFTGMAVKCMDDLLDIEYDQCVGRQTLAAKLGKATLPYSLLLLGTGIYLAKDYGLVLFLASYAIGMGHDLFDKMPTKLPGWAEGLAAVAVGMMLAGPLTMVWGLMVIGGIQFLDDLMDIYKDTQSGQRNAAIRFGVVETTLLTLICFLAAILLSPLDSVLVLLATPLVHITLEMLGGSP
jgi:1,4-dihydroxy-2-naphthoate octaprenyltransferase